MATTDHGDPRHYRRGCRCTPCTNAMARYYKQRRIARQRGLPGRIDAAPATAWARRLLDHGITPSEAAAIAPISDTTISNLLAGRTTRIYRAKAEAILAIPLPAPGYRPQHDGLVPATAATRRMQALAVAGFSTVALVPHTRIPDRSLEHIRSGDWINVHIHHHLAIRDTCEALWNADPAAHGIRPADAARTRLWAARLGWASLACWDDDEISNPKARPKGRLTTAA
jgi:hypothetical protein